MERIYEKYEYKSMVHPQNGLAIGSTYEGGCIDLSKYYSVDFIIDAGPQLSATGGKSLSFELHVYDELIQGAIPRVLYEDTIDTADIDEWGTAEYGAKKVVSVKSANVTGRYITLYVENTSDAEGVQTDVSAIAICKPKYLPLQTADAIL